MLRWSLRVTLRLSAQIHLTESRSSVPFRIRVSTSGTSATSDDFGASTPTANKVLVSGGPGQPTDWAAALAVVDAAYAANWAVTNWYIDGTVGDDTNNGTTAATPLKTGAELQKRLGPWAIWGQSVTVHVGINGMVDPLALHGERLHAADKIDVIGTPTQVATFVLTTYTAMNHNVGGVPNGPQITAATVAAWTVGTRLRQTTGANAGAIAFVLADLGGGIALTSIWSRLGTTGQFVDSMLPTVGQTFVIETLPGLPALDVDLAGPWPGNNSVDLNSDRSFGLFGVAVFTSTRLRVQGSLAESVLVYGVVLDGLLETLSPWNGGQWQLVSSLCRLWDPTNVLFQYCGVMPTTNPVWSATRVECGCQVAYSHCVLVGVRAFCQRGEYSVSDCYFHQFANPAIKINQQGNLAISGAGISGRSTVAGSYGMHVSNGSTLAIQSGMVLNLVGAAGAVRLVDAPAVDLTWAQFLGAVNDFQLKGTSVLGGGTGVATINVAYYDSTAQQPFAWYNNSAFLTNPGVLTTTKVSDTQFVVQSSSATDTSRIAWSMTPAGRDIRLARF